MHPPFTHEELAQMSAQVGPPYGDVIDEVLEERGKRYGSFTSHANIAQELKKVMTASENWNDLEDDQKEALEMIQHKIARILNGDSIYDDNWIDIAGYSTLIVNRIKKEK